MQNDGGRAHERAREIAERVGEVLEEPLTGELRRLSSGASRETFMFSTAARGELVLQIERDGNKLVEPPPQAALLRAAAEAGVPVPIVVADGGGEELLGRRWTIVEALPGSTDPTAILAEESSPGARELIDELAAALASIHRMTADHATLPTIEDPLAALRGWHDRIGEPHPVFELAFRALEADRPQSTKRTLVHGDFRIGNLMVAPSGLTGVLDWELAHMGDPVEDLGWLCVRAWRFSRPDRPAAGLATRTELLDAYERHSGLAVEPRALRWWELAGTLRWGVICVMQAFTHLSGAARSLEHAVIGRRACEVEWDLLELLEAPPPDGAPIDPVSEPLAARGPVLHDRPTMIELLDATRGALGDDVLPELEGRAAFQLRVALRALGIVRRELIHDEDHAAARAAALSAVACADERELAHAIRNGTLGLRERSLFPSLRAIVRAKLEVANPAYLNATRPPAREKQ